MGQRVNSHFYFFCHSSWLIVVLQAQNRCVYVLLLECATFLIIDCFFFLEIAKDPLKKFRMDLLEVLNEGDITRVRECLDSAESRGLSSQLTSILNTNLDGANPALHVAARAGHCHLIRYQLFQTILFCLFLRKVYFFVAFQNFALKMALRWRRTSAWGLLFCTQVH